MRWATIGIFLLLVVMSESRTNWFILAGSCCLTPIVKILRSPRMSLGLRITIVVLLALAVVLTTAVAADQLLSAAGRDATLSGRHTLWRGVNNIIAAKYPYLGAGYGAFFTEAGGIPDLAPYLTYWTGIPNHAHSGYLNVRADLGIPGLTVLTLLIVVLGFRLVRLLIVEPNRRVWMGFTCLFFLFMVNNYTESVSFKHSDIAWVIFSMIYLYVSNQPTNVLARRGAGGPRLAPLAARVQAAS
jgi:O-antigen ligase